MDEKKEYGKFVYDFAKKVIDVTGPRLPGSPEEAQGAAMIAEELQNVAGKPSVTEKFTMAPRASIAAIPILGLLGIISFVLFYVSPIASLISTVVTLIIAIVQVFTYSAKLDFLFKKEPSQNVYNTFEPLSGKVDRTIILSAHNDSSWCWQLSVKNPKTAIPKTVIGVVSVLALLVMSVVALCIGMYSFLYIGELATSDPLSGVQIFAIVLYILPVLCLPGCYWLCQYVSWDKSKASPGAMDNLTGTGLYIAVLKYFYAHPELAPANCRIVAAGMGAEEASLKGAKDFVQRHKDDPSLMGERTYVLNLDSFRDRPYFSVVMGDAWLGSKFDPELRDVALGVMNEMGLDPKVMLNPAGGCDSTPFIRAGVKTITLCAQNPTTTDYYHTFNDTIEGLDLSVLEDAFEMVLKLVDGTAKMDEAKHQGANS